MSTHRLVPTARPTAHRQARRSARSSARRSARRAARIAVIVGAVTTSLALASCVALPPVEDVGMPVEAVASQTAGPLGDGIDRLTQADPGALSDLTHVLRLPDTPEESHDCAWSTFTTVHVRFDDGSAATYEASSCAATGRDEALGLLVAEWAASP